MNKDNICKNCERENCNHTQQALCYQAQEPMPLMLKEKSALELACEYIVQLDMSLHSNDSKIQPNYCTQKNCKVKSAADCLACCKNYFRQQADIPDGWDVMREIIASRRGIAKCKRRHSKSKIAQNKYQAIMDEYDELIDKLQQAGIELDDVCK